MANVGDKLTVPESGWKRYDDQDSSIKKIGVTSAPNTAYYNGTRTVINVGGNIEFDFIGTRLILLSSVFNGYSECLKISIDNNLVEVRSQTSIAVSIPDSNYNNMIVWYKKEGMDNKRHKVIVENIGNSIATLDAVDIDSSGRLLHPEEVTKIEELEIGKRIRCNYRAPFAEVGTFSALGKESLDFIPTTISSTNSSGDFYFIMIEDWNGKKRLMADRYIQNSISWNSLNLAGVASGSGITINMGSRPTVPIMNSSITPGGITVTADSNYSSDYAYKAFDSNVGSRPFWYTLTTSPNEGHWLKLSYPTSKIITEIELQAFLVSGTSYSIKDFTLFGSTDDVNYEKIFSAIHPNDALTHKYQLNDRKKIFKHFRINILSSYYSQHNVGINDMQLFEDPTIQNDYELTVRLPTGGIYDLDKDNEWDRNIVNSTLNGTITAGDDSIWHWAGQQQCWTSTTGSISSTFGSAYRIIRGHNLIDTFSQLGTSGTTGRFRPILEIERLKINKMLILFEEDNYWYYNGSLWENTGAIPNDIEDKKIFYEKYGMDRIPFEAIDSLPDNFRISVWTDEKNARRTLKTNAIPLDQLVLPTKGINIRFIENIDFVKLTSKEVNKGKVRVITSFDEGITWYAHNGMEWININPKTDEVILLGMSPETLANITSAQWTDIRGDSKTMRFAYAISMEDITDSAEIDALITQMDMKGTWKKAVHGTHYDYEYPNNDDLLVTIYADGDYKINY
ncbi:discoidin domain-containing protein [Viridibacillus arvi]|uniref:F5/8 type C domain-containing protein n=1 Tax=Viridibacillus arvi TaxID=263475 RepID=A0A0M0LEI2_9BACL|nr:discoidin domain-containing protein [Viridibacillus arvi]KOO49485.1 hypothetical protein AMD00_14085 [Viridibacillus arvi]